MSTLGQANGFLLTGALRCLLGRWKLFFLSTVRGPGFGSEVNPLFDGSDVSSVGVHRDRAATSLLWGQV